MSINERQDEIIEEFQDFDDWMDKYQLLIDLGNDQAPCSAAHPCTQRLYTTGNPGCRPLLYREDRIERTLVAYTQQWPAGYGETDAYVCAGLLAALRFFLVVVDTLQTELSEITPMVIRGNVCLQRQRGLVFIEQHLDKHILIG